MSSFLYSIDLAVFRWINLDWACPFLDRFFSYITDFHNYYLLILFYLIYLWVVEGPKGRWVIGALIVAVTLSDQASAHLLKPLVDRLRPCNALPGVRTPVGISYAYSFPSSHAANSGAMMTLLAMAFRPWWPLFLLLALSVGLSRVYLGLHYPSDLLGGYALGALIGYGVWMGMEKLRETLQNKKVVKAPLKGRKSGARKRR